MLCGVCVGTNDDHHLLKPQNELQVSCRRSHFTIKSAIWLVLLVILITIFQGTHGKEADETDGDRTMNVSAMDRLRSKLFANYDKNSRPIRRGSPTNNTWGMRISYVDIDEMTSKLTMHSWMDVKWIDDNRSWNKSEYGNITSIYLKPDEVWKPDITLYNSAEESAAENYLGYSKIILTHDGTFLWSPAVIFTAYCNLNLRMWPYDTQDCKVKVGSQTLNFFDEEGLHPSATTSRLPHSTEWKIEYCQESFYEEDHHSYILCSLIMQRRSNIYTAVIFTPAFCIVLLALSTFWVPPQMGEKILLNCIVMGVIAAYLMYFARLFPILAENTPLVVLFYSSCLLLLSLSTLIAILGLHLSTSKRMQLIPEPMKNALNGRLGCILLLPRFELKAEPRSSLNNGTNELDEHISDRADSNSIKKIHSDINAMLTNPSVQFDWILLATAIDRIAFLCYFLIFAILSIGYCVYEIVLYISKLWLEFYDHYFEYDEYDDYD